MENGLVGGDWKREKEEQWMISAFPGQGLGCMARPVIESLGPDWGHAGGADSNI